MGIFGTSIALRVDLESPLNAVEFAWVGVDDGIGKCCVVVESIVKLVILGYKFVS